MNYWDIADGDEGWINVRALVTFLASCLVLEELALELSHVSHMSRSKLILPTEKARRLESRYQSGIRLRILPQQASQIGARCCSSSNRFLHGTEYWVGRGAGFAR